MRESSVDFSCRIFRQKQFEEQRMREFQEELNRNEVLQLLSNLFPIQPLCLVQALAKQGEKERKALELHHLKLYQQHKSQQAELNYQKNYQLAASIVDQILDLSTKMAEYRELTEKSGTARFARLL